MKYFQDAKKLIIISLILIVGLPAFSRTNNEIGRQLYSVANRIEKASTARADKARSEIAAFLVDLMMLNFNENTATWKPLVNGYYYDSKSVEHLYSRHRGVYKSTDGKMMGSFEVNCEDHNDPQERMYGYVKTTNVFFTQTNKTKNGHSKGLYQKFCKK